MAVIRLLISLRDMALGLRVGLRVEPQPAPRTVSPRYCSVMLTASEKFETGPGFASLYQHWNDHV